MVPELVQVKYNRSDGSVSQIMILHLGNTTDKMLGLRSDRLSARSIGIVKNSIDKISKLEDGKALTWFQDHLEDFSSAFVTLNLDQVDIFARYKVNGK